MSSHLRRKEENSKGSSNNPDKTNSSNSRSDKRNQLEQALEASKTPLKLSREQAETLDRLQPLIERARSDIERLKKAGIDTSEQEKRLQDAIRLRDSLLVLFR